AVPGMANRWLSKFTTRSLVVFEDAKQKLKARDTVKVAMPVRRELEELNVSSQSDDFFHILIFGGSQGARPINNVVSQAVLLGGEWLKRSRIVHQTGPTDFSRVSALYATKP